VILVDHQDRVLRWNLAAERMFGHSAEQAVGQSVHELLAPSDARDDAAGMVRFCRSGDGKAIGRTMELEAMRRDGSRIEVELSLSSVQVNGAWYALAVIRDITGRRRIEEALRRSEHNFHNVVEMNRSGILVVDAEGRIRFANSAAQKLLNRSAEELQGLPFGVPSTTLRQEMAVRRGDGSAGIAEMSATETRWEGEPAHLVMLHDITELKQAESQARYLALHDPLTGLPNRRMFLERLDRALRRARFGGERVALLFMDLNRFKPINDTLGHEIGDEVLRTFAKRVERCLRASDTVARLGGDEFAAVIESVGALSDVDAVVGKLERCLKPPMQVAGNDLYVGASMGVALYPDDGHDADILLRRADDAMYAAKRGGGSHFRYFSIAMETGDRAFLDIEQRLHGALANQELRVVYQPQVRISDGALKGCEALLRWHNPMLGSIPPDRFVPMLEVNGGISEVGSWVVDRVCGQLAHWRHAGLDPVPVAVNVSPRQLTDGDFPDLVERTLRRHRVPSKLLSLELTETAVVDDERAATDALNRLSRLGVALHMDDFGTGYSSLGMLRKLPFDMVKIDRTYVARIADNDDDAMLIAGIISMAHSLNKGVLAEGVETEAQRRLLDDYHCDFGQGWLFGRPAEPGEIRRLLGES